MNLFRHFIERAFENHLKSDGAGNRPERLQFKGEEVATVGLLYHVADEETDSKINGFVKELRDNNQKVTVIGYFKKNDLPVYCTQKMDWNILIPKSVNWFNKPVAPFVKSFCDQEFDLLIDLTMEDIQPIIYAGALSKARFKAGRYTERNARIYDLMIHTERLQTLDEFIQ